MAARESAKRKKERKEQRARLYGYAANVLIYLASIAREADMEEEFDRLAYAADGFASEAPPRRPQVVREEAVG